MLYKIRCLTKDSRTLIAVYRSLVEPHFDYCSVVWGNCSKMRADQLEKLQNRAARIITRADYSVRSCDILKELYIGQRCDKWKIQMNVMMYKVYRLTSEVHNYNLRGSKFDLQLPKANTNSLKRTHCLSWGNCME